MAWWSGPWRFVHERTCLCMCVCLKSHLRHVEHLKKYRWPAACRWDWNILIWGVGFDVCSPTYLNPSPLILPRGEKGAESEERERGNVKQREILMLSICPSYSASRGGVSVFLSALFNLKHNRSVRHHLKQRIDWLHTNAHVHTWLCKLMSGFIIFLVK